VIIYDVPREHQRNLICLVSLATKQSTEFLTEQSIMSQNDECQTPPIRRVSADHQPDTKRSNDRRLWHELEAGPPVTPFMTPPKYTEDRYDVDKSVEPDKKKLRTPPRKSGNKNRNRRSARHKITFLENSESDTLRSELSSVHATYHKVLRQKDEEIEKRTDHILKMCEQRHWEVNSLMKERDDFQHDLAITEEELSIFQKSEKEWIGRTLKLKFILDEIKKIGALPEDHASWVDPMVEDIEIPEVSIDVKDEFVPTAQTDNIDWVDEEDDYEEEEDIIGDYLENETAGDHCVHCGEMGHDALDCPHRPADPRNYRQPGDPGAGGWGNMDVFVYRMSWVAIERCCFSHPTASPGEEGFGEEEGRDILEKSATTIQEAWRNRQILKKAQLDRELDENMTACTQRVFDKFEYDDLAHYYAITIQSIWRGYRMRSVLK
jgi:hypothetical protein